MIHIHNAYVHYTCIHVRRLARKRRHSLPVACLRQLEHNSLPESCALARLNRWDYTAHWRGDGFYYYYYYRLLRQMAAQKIQLYTQNTKIQKYIHKTEHKNRLQAKITVAGNYFMGKSAVSDVSTYMLRGCWRLLSNHLDMSRWSDV